MKKNIYNITIILLLMLLTIILVIGITKSNKENTLTNNPQTDLNIATTSTSTTQTPAISKTDNRFEGLKMTNENIGIPVLYYHSIDPTEKNEVTMSPNKLKQQLQYIKDSGYTTLTMNEINDYINNNKEIPEKSIVITFDDGYMDNYTNAFPILKELDMKATIFVIANGINDGYYLSSDQLKEMSNYGIDIESHTNTHCHLNTLSYTEQLNELTKSKQTLEDILKKPITSIAYPFGDYNKDSIKAAKEAGYSLAFTTNSGYADRSTGNLNLNRIYISSNYNFEEFKLKLLKQTK